MPRRWRNSCHRDCGANPHSERERQRERRRRGLMLAPSLHGSVLHSAHGREKLLDYMFAGQPALLGCRQIQCAERSRLRVAGGPLMILAGPAPRVRLVHCQVWPSGICVTSSGSAPGALLSQPIQVEVEIHRRLQLAGMGAATGTRLAHFAIPVLSQLDGESGCSRLYNRLSFVGYRN